MKTNIITNHLIENSGHDPQLSLKCTRDEVIRMKVKGALIYIPTILAFFGMYLTIFYTSANNALAILGGFVWAVMIYLVDKSLMASVLDGASYATVGRVILGILNSIVVAECIVAFLFADIIQRSQAEILHQDIAQIEQRYREYRIQEEGEIEVQASRVQELTAEYHREMDGSGGSGNRGIGIIAEAKKESLEKQELVLRQMREQLELNEAQRELQKEEEIAAIHAAQANGISGKLKALHEIEDPYIHVAAILVRLLLLFMEILPLFMKFGAAKPTDIYEDLLAQKAKAHKEKHRLSVESDKEVMDDAVRLEAARNRKKMAYDHSLRELEDHHQFIQEMWDLRSRHDSFLAKARKKNKTMSEKTMDDFVKANQTMWDKMAFQNSVYN